MTTYKVEAGRNPDATSETQWFIRVTGPDFLGRTEALFDSGIEWMARDLISVAKEAPIGSFDIEVIKYEDGFPEEELTW